MTARNFLFPAFNPGDFLVQTVPLKTFFKLKQPDWLALNQPLF